MPTELIPLSKLIADPACQPPDRISAETADEYLQAMLAGATFPPVSATFDGDAYWLWDGFHRLQAIQRMGRAVIEVDWQPGGRLDAIEAACGANAAHGLRRTNKEKRWAVDTMFWVLDEKGDNQNDVEIARRCGVSSRFVGMVRTELVPSLNGSMMGERTVTRGGTTYVQNTANIGRTKREPVRDEWSGDAEPVVETCPDCGELMAPERNGACPACGAIPAPPSPAPAVPSAPPVGWWGGGPDDGADDDNGDEPEGIPDDPMAALVAHLTEGHMETWGGYPYDWRWFGDELVVAALDPGKDHHATVIEVYEEGFLMRWAGDAVAYAEGEGCGFSDALRESRPDAG